MGHADSGTTVRYLHYQRRGDEMQRVGVALVAVSPAAALQADCNQATATEALQPAA